MTELQMAAILWILKVAVGILLGLAGAAIFERKLEQYAKKRRRMQVRDEAWKWYNEYNSKPKLTMVKGGKRA